MTTETMTNVTRDAMLAATKYARRLIRGGETRDTILSVPTNAEWQKYEAQRYGGKGSKILDLGRVWSGGLTPEWHGLSDGDKLATRSALVDVVRAMNDALGVPAPEAAKADGAKRDGLQNPAPSGGEPGAFSTVEADEAKIRAAANDRARSVQAGRHAEYARNEALAAAARQRWGRTK